MTGKILEIDNVGATPPRGCERGHSKRVDSHRRIEPELPHIKIKEGLHGAPRQRPRPESVSSLAASGILGREQCKATIVTAAHDIKPFLQSFNCLRVQRHPPFLPALAADFQNLVPG